jgi:hypothetical protein
MGPIPRFETETVHACQFGPQETVQKVLRENMLPIWSEIIAVLLENRDLADCCATTDRHWQVRLCIAQHGS